MHSQRSCICFLTSSLGKCRFDWTNSINYKMLVFCSWKKLLIDARNSPPSPGGTDYEQRAIDAVLSIKSYDFSFQFLGEIHKRIMNYSPIDPQGPTILVHLPPAGQRSARKRITIAIGPHYNSQGNVLFADTRTFLKHILLSSKMRNMTVVGMTLTVD